MSGISLRTDAPGAEHIVDEALLRANRLRIAGRWNEALTLLRDVQPVADAPSPAARARLALSTARILAEQAGFGGFDTWEERSQYFDVALTNAQQTTDLALLGEIWDARGMSIHHQYLDTGRAAEPPDELPSFERGLAYRQQVDDQQGIAESLFHIGLVYGVVRQDHQQALPFFQQSYTLAQTLGDQIIASYAIRHIAFAQHDAGDTPQARTSLQESLHLREQAGFIPGVAMALVMLADADAELGQRTQAIAHLQRAKAIFLSLDAPNKVTWVEQLITEFQQNTTP